jgi:hypothetical protein
VGILENETDKQRRLQALRSMQRLLDEAFRVPGTRLRFGWDAIVGLVPGFGDVVTAVMAGAIIVQARAMRVPGIVIARMLMNVGIDLTFGLVPFLGDVADVFWKSNTRNLALLERHAAAPRGPSAGDWVFVLGLMAAVIVIAALPFMVLGWLLSGFAR